MRAIFTIVVLLHCAVPALAGDPFGIPFALSVGDSTQLGDDELSLGFTGIVSDSRCPQNVVCVWEGDATADLWLTLPGEVSEDFVLHTFGGAEQSIDRSVYTISLLNVTPYPIDTVPIDPLDYVVELVVIRKPVAASERSWGAAKAVYR